MTNDWLEQIYTWDESNRDLLKEIFKKVERRGADEFDALLPKIDVQKLSPLAMIGFLISSQAEIGYVPRALLNRPDFYNRVEEELLRRYPERVDGMLRGLK